VRVGLLRLADATELELVLQQKFTGHVLDVVGHTEVVHSLWQFAECGFARDIEEPLISLLSAPLEINRGLEPVVGAGVAVQVNRLQNVVVVAAEAAGGLD